MNRREATLPLSMLAGYTTIAAFAALGALSILPGSLFLDAFPLAVPILTAIMAGGLLVGGHRVVSQVRQEAAQNASTDAETGLATATAARNILDLEFAAAQRGRPLAVVLIRLDHLPAYQVRHGHVIGKQLLRLAGRALRKHRRSMHLTALHDSAPGTYLSILSGMDLDGACVYATRVRKELMALQGLPELPPVSVGVATYDLSMSSAGDLLEQAERALVRGAESGGKVVAVGG